MNQLIKVEVNERHEQVVSARMLHEGLGIGKDFTSWFKQQVDRLQLVEARDYVLLTFLGEQTGSGGHNRSDYVVTLDIAKHICMISGGEKASEIRNYFIQVERDWNSPDKVIARALQFAHNRIHNLEDKLEQQRPKVEFFDAVANSKDAIQIGDAAKVLGIRGVGRNKLFEILRERGVLMKDNIPYQEYIDRGYFRTIEQKYTTPSGETKISIKTLVYQRGLEYIRKLVQSKESKAVV